MIQCYCRNKVFLLFCLCWVLLPVILLQIIITIVLFLVLFCEKSRWCVFLFAWRGSSPNKYYVTWTRRPFCNSSSKKKHRNRSNYLLALSCQPSRHFVFEFKDKLRSKNARKVEVLKSWHHVTLSVDRSKTCWQQKGRGIGTLRARASFFPSTCDIRSCRDRMEPIAQNRERSWTVSHGSNSRPSEDECTRQRLAKPTASRSVILRLTTPSSGRLLGQGGRWRSLCQCALPWKKGLCGTRKWLLGTCVAMLHKSCWTQYREHGVSGEWFRRVDDHRAQWNKEGRRGLSVLRCVPRECGVRH